MTLTRRDESRLFSPLSALTLARLEWNGGGGGMVRTRAVEEVCGGEGAAGRWLGGLVGWGG